MELRLKDQKNNVTASELFYSVQHMYKDWDYRCLVPYSHKDPTKWKTYEMHDYRKAFSEETLKKVDQFKYDNNFFNWRDPKVLKYFTKSTKSSKKAWKKTYGLQWITMDAWDGMHTSPPNITKCFKKCARYVREAFKNPSHGSPPHKGVYPFFVSFLGKILSVKMNTPHFDGNLSDFRRKTGGGGWVGGDTPL